MSTGEIPPYKIIPEPVEISPAQRRRQRILSHSPLLICSAIIAAIVIVAIFAPLIAPHDPYLQNLSQRKIPPIWHAWLYGYDDATWNHILGTDRFGRDYLSRLIYGARISLTVGVMAMVISGAIGITLGMLAGYFGGRIDMVVNFLISLRLSLPLILVALVVVALYGGSITTIICVLGLLIWDRYAVVMRSVTMQLRDLDYVTIARTIGCSNGYIIAHEVLPNVLSPLIVVATFEMALAILLEATLSFLGLGVQSPEPSWGLMLAEAKGDIFFDSWLIMIPGTAIFILIFAINIVGDGIRDTIVPENRS